MTCKYVKYSVWVSAVMQSVLKRYGCIPGLKRCLLNTQRSQKQVQRWGSSSSERSTLSTTPSVRHDTAAAASHVNVVGF